jgi:demethylmenaquinone methyltransferase / 2-methoxy-6-polyprenyl-1,4-benzoquinol methylase
VLPLVGRAISGSPEAYRYLATSIGSFIAEEDVRLLLASAGLESVTTRRLTGGIAGLHRGQKPTIR